MGSRKQPKRSVLYYPYINIADSAWLRQAILYWDEVGSIVPKNYEGSCAIDESAEQAYLRSLGVYKEYDPIDLMHDSPSIRALEQELLAVVDSEEFRMSIPRLRRDREYVWVLRHKIADSTVEELFKTQLVRLGREHDRLYFERHAFLLYMALLAKYMAANCDDTLSPGTDQPEYLDLAFRRGASSATVPSLALALHRILPAPKPETPFEAILDFKLENARDLQQLWLLISNFQAKLTQCTSKADIRDAIADFGGSISIELDELCQSLRAKKIEFVFGTLTTLLTLRAGALADKLDSAVSVPLVGGVIGVGACVTTALKAQALRRNSAIAYLHKLQDQMII